MSTQASTPPPPGPWEASFPDPDEGPETTLLPRPPEPRSERPAPRRAAALPPRSAVAQGTRLRVDWPRCEAHGLCAALLPEMIVLDEWGYPFVARTPVPTALLNRTRDAVAACPALALRLTQE